MSTVYIDMIKTILETESSKHNDECKSLQDEVNMMTEEINTMKRQRLDLEVSDDDFAGAPWPETETVTYNNQEGQNRSFKLEVPRIGMTFVSAIEADEPFPEEITVLVRNGDKWEEHKRTPKGYTLDWRRSYQIRNNGVEMLTLRVFAPWNKINHLKGETI